MNTRSLLYITRVAEEHSISAAAKKLYIAQPSLSQYISKVEKELGYELFDRSTLPLKLTPEGEIYVETAKEILNLEQEMIRRLRDMNGTETVKLSIGVSPYNGLMSMVLKRFFDVFPTCKVDIQDSVGTHERLKLLEQGQLDLCVQPITDAIGNRFTCEEIMMEDLVLVVPEEYPVNQELADKKSDDPIYPVIDLKCLRLFADIPFIMVNDNKYLRKTVNNLFRQVAIEPKIKMVCHKSEGCLAMSAAGIGATIVQMSLLKYSDAYPEVKCYVIRQGYVRNRIAVVYLKNRYMSKAARTFINILKEY